MELDREFLQKLENTLDTLHPERGKIPLKVIGFGEISLVFEIVNDPLGVIAFKRLPIFDSVAQVEHHIEIYTKYNELFRDLGINMPDFGAVWVYRQPSKKKTAQPQEKAKGSKADSPSEPTPITLYCAQHKLPSASICNRVIHEVPEEDVKRLVQALLRETKKVWDYNLAYPENAIGMDTQISNWALIDYDPAAPRVPDNPQLFYLDTSTPLFRVNNVEQIEGKLFLTSAPGFLRWTLDGSVLSGVINRYYDWKLTTIDIIANFYKEQLPERIPGLIEVANDFFTKEAPEHKIPQITREELDKYYKSDKRIWSVFQALRRLDRWIKTKIRRMNYDFYLPGRIKR
jgi:hypothetical protein